MEFQKLLYEQHPKTIDYINSTIKKLNIFNCINNKNYKDIVQYFKYEGYKVKRICFFSLCSIDTIGITIYLKKMMLQIFSID